MFKVDTIENVGDNWLIADFGTDQDGKHYILTTDGVRGSELSAISGGAQQDAELVCRLLNEHLEGGRPFVMDVVGDGDVRYPVKACPFCGGEWMFVDVDDSRDQYIHELYCDDCGASLKSDPDGGFENVLAKWNREGRD